MVKPQFKSVYDQMLWAVHQHLGKTPEEALTQVEIAEKAGIPKGNSTASSSMARIWEKLGEHQAGIGMLSRLRKGGKKKYAYFKATDEMDNMDFADLQQVTNSRGQFVEDEPKPMEAEEKEQFKKDPQTLNVNVNFKFDFNVKVEFGWSGG